MTLIMRKMAYVVGLDSPTKSMSCRNINHYKGRLIYDKVWVGGEGGGGWGVETFSFESPNFL